MGSAFSLFCFPSLSRRSNLLSALTSSYRQKPRSDCTLNNQQIKNKVWIIKLQQIVGFVKHLYNITGQVACISFQPKKEKKKKRNGKPTGNFLPGHYSIILQTFPLTLKHNTMKWKIEKVQHLLINKYWYIWYTDKAKINKIKQNKTLTIGKVLTIAINYY